MATGASPDRCRTPSARSEHGAPPTRAPHNPGRARVNRQHTPALPAFSGEKRLSLLTNGVEPKMSSMPVGFESLPAHAATSGLWTPLAGFLLLRRVGVLRHNLGNNERRI